jgi:hypothetical protein
MLIQWLEHNPQERERLIGTIERRIRFMEGQAKQPASRAATGSEWWQQPMIVASLWLDVVESAAAIGKWSAASNALRRASKLLLDLGLPSGAALTQSFLKGTQVSKSRAVLNEWLRRETNVGSAIKDEGDGTVRADGMWARGSPQQWAYLGLAADALPREDALRQVAYQRLSEQVASPFGRSRMPLGGVLAVLKAEPTLHQTDESVRRDSSEYDALGQVLVSTHRSLQLARSNTYLWERALSPVPLFDLETALLVTSLLHKTSVKAPGLVERLTEGLSAADKGFVDRFVRTAFSLTRRAPPIAEPSPR